MIFKPHLAKWRNEKVNIPWEISMILKQQHGDQKGAYSARCRYMKPGNVDIHLVLVRFLQNTYT